VRRQVITISAKRLGGAISQPQVRRVATRTGAVLGGVAFIWVLLVPLASWLARHDAGPATGTAWVTALQNARSAYLTLFAGVLAAGALFFTARNYRLSEQGHRLTEQGQVTDRYTKAIEQLGSDKVDIRIGGIYALERIARDSARDQPTVMAVLSTFVRVHSCERQPSVDGTSGTPPTAIEQLESPPLQPDVQAALTVIARRDVSHDIETIDLHRANLRMAYLHGANMTGTDFTRANLVDAVLRDATLTGATLYGADLSRADLQGTRLTYADLTRAKLTDTNLVGASLKNAYWPNRDVPDGWSRNAAGQLERNRP
jgi:hypothetical protein